MAKTKTTKPTKPTSRVTKKAVENETQIKTSAHQNTSANTSNLREILEKNKVVGAVLVGLVALALIAFMLYKEFLVSAYVNGEAISRIDVIKQLEKTNGESVVNQLVTEKLILQEAGKRNITVSQADIDKELKNIEASIKAQGMTLDQALQSEGITKDQLNEQIRIQALVQKMVKPATVTDKEVADYIVASGDQITEEQQAAAGFTDSVKAQLTQQKQQQAIQTFVQELKSKAKIEMK